MNKTLRNVIILVAVLAVLGGGIWWVMSINPEQNTDSPSQSTSSSESIYKVDETDVVGVEILGGEETLKFTKNGDEWSLKGTDSNQLSQTKVKSLVSSAASISSATHVTENTDECGMDNPTVIVKLTLTDGHTDTITVGSMSPVLGSYFVKVNDGDIYTIGSSKVEDFLKGASHYTSFNRVDISADDITEVKIERSGKNTVEMKLADEESSLNSWVVTQPYKKAYPANDQYIQENILTPIGELEVSALAEGTNFGLDKPKAVLTIVTAKANDDGTRGEPETTVIKIGNTNGDKTYIEYQGTAFEIKAGSLGFTDVEEFLLVSKLLSLVQIKTLNSVCVTGGGNTYQLDVSHTAIGQDDDEMTFTINGQHAAEKKSKTVYQEIIGLSADGVYKGEALGDTIAEVVFNSEGETKTITFKSINDMSAAYIVDGNAEFTVKKTTVNQMLEKLAEFANNPA